MLSAPTSEAYSSDPPRDAPRLVRPRDLLAEWAADADEAHAARAEGRARGPVTGLPRLDEDLGGHLAPGIHVLHGNTGTGKTALALQLAGACGAPCLFVSTEVGVLELLYRHTARITRTSLTRLRNHLMPKTEELALAERAITAAPDLVFVDATQGGFPSPEWLRQAIIVTRGDARHVLVVLDSLHTWVDMAPVEADEYTRLNEGLAALRQLAQQLRCPILTTCERNRLAVRAGGVNAGAGSRKIEYGAETVLNLDRDLDAGEDAVGEVPITLKLEKNRSGPGGRKLALKFHNASQQFRPV